MEHVDIASFLLALASALLAAKVFGELLQRVGQPAVLGELIAGVLLGPSLLGLVPLSTGVFLVAEIGVILLLFEVGLETDLQELIKVGGRAMAVAVLGMALPFLGGFLLTRLVGYEALTAIFVGAALTATSIGITARVLTELKALKTEEGQIILGAAVADDVLGLVVLAVVSQISAAGGVEMGLVLRATGLAIGFLVVALVVGLPLGVRLVRTIEQAKVRGVLVSASVGVALLIAVAAKKAGSAEIIGAFATGLVLARTNRRHELSEALKPVVDVFAPVFFVYVGAQVNVAYLNPMNAENRASLLLALGLTVVGLLGKFAAGYGAWGPVRKAFIGAGMIPRGEVGLIFASIGRSTTALPERVFVAVVLAVFFTTFAAPPILKALRPPAAGKS
ncbi:MAG TPA: cation:proton antiporter [Thermoanaerobaculia bacterium]|nr:cation:proton antiporter [Thermoanaerobaculia bacterium]